MLRLRVVFLTPIKYYTSVPSACALSSVRFRVVIKGGVYGPPSSRGMFSIINERSRNMYILVYIIFFSVSLTLASGFLFLFCLLNRRMRSSFIRCSHVIVTVSYIWFRFFFFFFRTHRLRRLYKRPRRWPVRATCREARTQCSEWSSNTWCFQSVWTFSTR